MKEAVRCNYAMRGRKRLENTDHIRCTRSLEEGEEALAVAHSDLEGLCKVGWRCEFQAASGS